MLHCLHLIRTSTIHIRIQITSLQSLPQVVRTPDEEERLSASVTAVVADHCYTTSPPVASTSKYSTSANAESQRTPKQTGQRVHSRSDISSSPSLESQPSCSFSHYKEPLLNHHATVRIGFSDVSVFYFDRNIAGCSVPRAGAHTMGMEV